jgi:hypothetical protein
MIVEMLRIPHFLDIRLRDGTVVERTMKMFM